MDEKIKNFDEQLESFIVDINPTLTEKEAKNKILAIKEKFANNFLDIRNNNPFLMIMLLFLGYPDFIDKAKDVLIEFFKDKTGVEATFEDIKLYNDIDSELSIYKTIKEYLETNKPSNETPPILTMILSCKDMFIAPLNDKIKVLSDKQEYILNKYK